MNYRPVIGISSGAREVPISEGTLDSHYVGRAYTRAVAEAGGWPVVLPAVPEYEREHAQQAAAWCDGIVLSGGCDIHPATYGCDYSLQEKPDLARDHFEVTLVRAARDQNVPVLGICRGMELINVALGGTLLEYVVHDVEPEVVDTFEGVQYHPVLLDPESRVQKVFDSPDVDVMCLHHQAPDPSCIGEGLAVTGRSTDGIVEALEDPDPNHFMLGVLWHPEHMINKAPLQRRLYEALVTAARERKEALSTR